jgi:20S proteasome alpha/beta subunit
MLFAGFDHTGTALYHLDPSGTYIRCIAKAIGAGGDGAEQALIEQCKECDRVLKIFFRGMKNFWGKNIILGKNFCLLKLNFYCKQL